MEVELAENHARSKEGPDPANPREFAKDEAVLARFGKRQQLRVRYSINAAVAL